MNFNMQPDYIVARYVIGISRNLEQTVSLDLFEGFLKADEFKKTRPKSLRLGDREGKK